MVGETGTEAANGTLYAASFALLIGASDYQDNKAWDDLPGVLTDLDEVGKALEQHGFVVERLLNPTRQQFRETLDSFIDRHGFKYDNRLLVYFAGHGIVRRREDLRDVGYLVMKDAPAVPRFREDASEFLKKVVNFDEIDGYAKRILAKHAMFVFDSCNSGFLIQKQRGDKKSDEFVRNVAMQPVRVYLTAGNASQKVWDDSQFRRRFILGINGDADSNGDGYVLDSELGPYLKSRVYDDTRSAQTPLYAKIEDSRLNQGDFVFKTAAPAERVTVEDVFRKAEESFLALELSTMKEYADQAIRMAPRNPVAYMYKVMASLDDIIFKSEDIDVTKDIDKIANEILHLSQFPRSSNEYLARAIAFKIKEEDERAKKDLLAALKLNPNNALALGLSAFSVESDDVREKVLAYLNEAIHSEPKFALAYFVRAMMFSAADEHARALAEMNEFVKLRGAYNFFSLYVQAEAKLSSQTAKEAESEQVRSTLDSINELSKREPLALAYLMGVVLFDDDLNSEDEAHYMNQAVALAPSVSLLYLNRADSLEGDAAISDYNEAILLDYKSTDAYFGRASTFIEMKKEKEALADLERVVEISPESPSVYSRRAFRYSKLAKYDLALADLTKALELSLEESVLDKEDKLDLYQDRAKLLAKMGKCKEALNNMASAMKLCQKASCKEEVSGLREKIENLQRLDNTISEYQNSRTTLTDAVKNERAEKYKERAIIFSTGFDFRDYKQAIENYHEALKLTVDQVKKAEVITAISKVYDEMKDPAANIAFLSQQIDEFSKQPGWSNEFLYQLRADTYVNTGQNELALADWSKMIEMRTGSTDADNEAKLELREKRARLFIKTGKITEALAEVAAAIDYCKNEATEKQKAYKASLSLLQKGLEELKALNDTIAGYKGEAATLTEGDRKERVQSYLKRSKIFSENKELKDTKKAVSDIEKAIDLTVDQNEKFDLYVTSAGHYKELGDNATAIAQYTQAIDLALTNSHIGSDKKEELADLYEKRADLHYKIREYDKAKADYDKAVELSAPGEKNEERGDLCILIARYEDAIKDYSTLIKVKDADSNGHYEYYEKRAKAWRRLGNNAEAEKDDRKAEEVKKVYEAKKKNEPN